MAASAPMASIAPERAFGTHRRIDRPPDFEGELAAAWPRFAAGIPRSATSSRREGAAAVERSSLAVAPPRRCRSPLRWRFWRPERAGLGRIRPLKVSLEGGDRRGVATTLQIILS